MTQAVAGAPAARAPQATVLFVGRPNAGKSSLFNRLTGGSAHVGNFPGITVEVLEGSARLPHGGTARVYDLPGLYAFDPRLEPGTDERITLDFVDARRTSEGPLVLAMVLDATQLELGLALVKNALSYTPGLRWLLVVSHLDVLRDEGRLLDETALSRATGCPVVGLSARDRDARGLLEAALGRALDAQAPASSPTFDPSELAKAVVSAPSAARATRMHSRERTERIDSVLLHPLLGPILFVVIMGGLFAAVFLVADPASAICDALLEKLGTVTRPALGGGTMASLVVDGVLGGAGTVAAFLPQVVILIAAMELLESSGYLARAAFLVDRVFRVAGLGGKAFMPLLTAHACAVPAIAATRVLRDPWERLTTILVIPLMACSARLPVYSLIVATFFGGGALRKGLICTALYLAGAGTGLFASVVMRRTITKSKRRGLPLVLEMPLYRAPLLAAIAARCGREAVDFLRRTGTVIVAASIVLWVLLHVPVRPAASDTELPIERSVAAAIGRGFEPITRPLGFDWRINVGLIGSFGARELMIGTLGVIFGVEDADAGPSPLAQKIAAAKTPSGAPAYTTATAVSLLVFFVIACQCMSTLSAVRRETRSWRWPAFVVGYTYVFAYVAAAVAFQATRLFAHG